MNSDPPATADIVFRRKSSATPSGSTTASVSAFETSRTSLQNAASRSPTKPSACGASSSVPNTPARSSGDRAAWVTRGTWMRSSSPSRVNDNISGVLSIKTAT